jgi:uncharacterized protein (DUF433 family)
MQISARNQLTGTITEINVGAVTTTVKVGLLPGMEQTLPPFDRITVDPDKLGGQPCIRGYRFSVEHLLELLAAGWAIDEIRVEFPFIEPEDVQQSLRYAAALARNEIYIPLQESA